MQKYDSINVIPFIDIMLVLLAIVLTTASFVQTGALDITPPHAASAPRQHDPRTVEIGINAAGELSLNGQRSDLAAITARIDTLQADTPVSLLIDEQTAFGEFVQIIALLKARAHSRVSIQTATTL